MLFGSFAEAKLVSVLYKEDVGHTYVHVREGCCNKASPGNSENRLINDPILCPSLLTTNYTMTATKNNIPHQRAVCRAYHRFTQIRPVTHNKQTITPSAERGSDYRLPLLFGNLKGSTVNSYAYRMRCLWSWGNIPRYVSIQNFLEWHFSAMSADK